MPPRSAPDKLLRELDTALSGFIGVTETFPRLLLIDVLASSKDARAQNAAVAIRSLGAKDKVMPTLLSFGISYHEIADWAQQMTNSRSRLKATYKAVEVLNDIAEDARTRRDACVACDGTGRRRSADKKTGDPITLPCGECKGKGMIVTIGDNTARRLLLEVAGLTQKGGVTVNQNTANVNVPPPSGPEDFTTLLQQALNKRPPPPLLQPAVEVIEAIEAEEVDDAQHDSSEAGTADTAGSKDG